MRSPHYLAVITLVLTLAGCGGVTTTSSAGGTAAAPTPSGTVTSQNSGQAGDVMFAQMMIPHHQQAIVMADLALRDPAGASSQVRTLARDIKAAQGPEIQTMTRWLQEWGAPAASSSMGHGVTGMMSDEQMTALTAKTGTEFDREWLAMMIQHHRGAITMANDVLATTSNPDVEKLATAVVQAQQKEITTMQGLLR